MNTPQATPNTKVNNNQNSSTNLNTAGSSNNTSGIFSSPMSAVASALTRGAQYALFGAVSVYVAHKAVKTLWGNEENNSATDSSLNNSTTLDDTQIEGENSNAAEGEQIEGKVEEPVANTPISNNNSNLALNNSSLGNSFTQEAEGESKSIALPPLRIAIISPSTLLHYGNLLAGGFQSLAQEETKCKTFSIDNYSPNADESASIFAQRVRNSGNHYNLIIVQLHGCDTEIPVAFENYKIHNSSANSTDSGQISATKLVLLVHRPEEVLERHWQRLYTQNIHTLLGNCDGVVLLGSAFRKLYANLSREIYIIPHGFSNLDDSLVLSTEKSLASLAVVGSITTWADMRWLSDLIYLHKAYLRVKTASHRVLFYVAGNFLAWKHPKTGQTINELEIIQRNLAKNSEINGSHEASQNNSDSSIAAVIISAKQVETALEGGEFAPTLLSFKEYLYSLSDSGAKLVILSGALRNSSLLALQLQLIDFNTQLYREILADFRPKIEYSANLHSFPGLNLPILFNSAALEDISNEGLQFISVNPPPAAPEPAELSAAQQDSVFFPESYYPDYHSAVQKIYFYQQNPQLYEKTRLENLKAGQKLCFKQIAARYMQILE
jgi:hypothetical protein